jgi:hypothetical protein
MFFGDRSDPVGALLILLYRLPSITARRASSPTLPPPRPSPASRYLLCFSIRTTVISTNSIFAG